MLLAGMAAMASAAPNVANTNQKESLLICPKAGKLSASVFMEGEKLDHESREILVQFSHEIDAASLEARLDLNNGTGVSFGGWNAGPFFCDSTGKTVSLTFDGSGDGWLHESSKYFIDVKKGLRYVIGVDKKGNKRYARLLKNMRLSFVTSSSCPLDQTLLAGNGADRTKYIVISDIHMGDARAQAVGYSTFTENVTQLQHFLDLVYGSAQSKELIIAGDLFDAWALPVDAKPFEPPVANIDDFFESIARNPQLGLIIEKLNKIADSGAIRFVYVPGNHDMLMTETAMRRIFPSAVWAGKGGEGGEVPGAGVYGPEKGICIEHGHVYDFYNAPDTLSHPSSILPPGYFVTRMEATRKTTGAEGAPTVAIQGFINDIFYLSWEFILQKMFGTLQPDIPPIVTGIDGYTDSYTHSQIRDLYYNADIGGQWVRRQTLNGVKKPESGLSILLTAARLFIWGDMQIAAQREYFETGKARIVVFGHNHRATVKGYNSDNLEILSGAQETLPPKARLGQAAKVYANSGTWTDTVKGFTNRTYIVVSPARDPGALDTVSLYQFNSVDAERTMGSSVLLGELNIHP
jgi:UDP-2,3-diacylglucosamine pyrophosphatase LpxH